MTTITVIGNVCVDLIADVPENFIPDHGLTKSACTTLTSSQHISVLDALSYDAYAGGSGANMAAAMGLLGLDVHFVGPFSDDVHSDLVWESLTACGVKCHGRRTGASPAQNIFTFITPDRERSFACYYDQAVGLDWDTLVPLGTKSDYVILDGYSLLYGAIRAQIENLFACTEMNRKLVLCPNDVSVISEAHETVHKLWRDCGYCVMNELEYEAINLLNNQIPIADQKKGAAITCSEKGAVLYDKNRSISVPSQSTSSTIVNTSGAGDAFTAGYMYGLVHRFNLEKTGHIASLCAAAVTQSVSPRLSREDARRIRKEIA